MELVHDFTVPVPAAQTWNLLVDIERIAPCLPGAAVTSVDGDTFEGGMKIKVGPIGMMFKGDGRFIEKDEVGKRAVLVAKGRDAKGNGGAQATVTVTLHEHDGVTAAHVVTDMSISGKAAQFGSGVVKDISNKMLAQFTANLSQMIESGGANEGVQPSASSSPSQTSAPSGDAGLDAMGLLLGSDSFQKTAKPIFALAGGLLIGYLYGKNRTLERMLRRV